MNGMREKTSRHSGFLNEYREMSYSSLNIYSHWDSVSGWKVEDLQGTTGLLQQLWGQ